MIRFLQTKDTPLESCYSALLNVLQQRLHPHTEMYTDRLAGGLIISYIPSMPVYYTQKFPVNCII